MRSRATQRFWACFDQLPPPVPALAEKSYRLWQENPNHPSLRFRRLKGSTDRFTVRVGEHHRALGTVRGDEIVWVWIGTHAEYDRLTS